MWPLVSDLGWGAWVLIKGAVWTPTPERLCRGLRGTTAGRKPPEVLSPSFKGSLPPAVYSQGRGWTPTAPVGRVL